MSGLILLLLESRLESFRIEIYGCALLKAEVFGIVDEVILVC